MTILSGVKNNLVQSAPKQNTRRFCLAWLLRQGGAGKLQSAAMRLVSKQWEPMGSLQNDEGCIPDIQDDSRQCYPWRGNGIPRWQQRTPRSSGENLDSSPFLWGRLMNLYKRSTKPLRQPLPMLEDRSALSNGNPNVTFLCSKLNHKRCFYFSNFKLTV